MLQTLRKLYHTIVWLSSVNPIFAAKGNMTKRNLTKELLTQLSGQQNIISVARVYIELTQDHTAAIVLSQLVYWQGTKGPDEYFYKTDEELGQECVVTSKQLWRIRTALEPFGVTTKRMGIPAKMYYHVDMDVLAESIAQVLPGGNDKSFHTEEQVMPSLEEQVTTERKNIPYIHKTTTETTNNEEKDGGANPTTFKKPKQTSTPKNKTPQPPSANALPYAGGESGVKVATPLSELVQRQYGENSKKHGGPALPWSGQQKYKLLAALEGMSESDESLTAYVAWVFDNWADISYGDEILGTHALPPIFVFTSAFYWQKLFTKFVRGDKVAPKLSVNERADRASAEQRKKGTAMPTDIELDL